MANGGFVTEELVFFELDSYIFDDAVAGILNGLKCGKPMGLDDY